MPHRRRKLGDLGEELAVRRLEEVGFTILARNWRCDAGELDIVGQEIAPDYAQAGVEIPWLVLVEVRTRRGAAFGTALQSITPRKQAKLREVAERYVQAVNWQGPWRIDVIGVQLDRSGRLLAIDHVRHAVGGT
jgi:putative endonuclease